MKITAFAVNRPVTTIMLFLGLVLFGLLAYSRLAVNLMPELNLPAMVINTSYFGASPEEIESEITDKIEKELATISGMKMLQSFSTPDNSMIVVQFNMGKDADKALDEVKAKLDLALPYLPQEAERPLVQQYKLSDAPVLDLVVSGDMAGAELYDYVDKHIKNKLSRIEGVSKVRLSGGELREIQVLADKTTMYDLKMNLTDLSDYIKFANQKLSAGNFVRQHRAFSVEVGEQYKTAADVANAYIPTPIGQRQLRDIASVKDTIADVSSKAVFFNVAEGEKYANIVSVGILKNTSANAVQLAREIKTLVVELNQDLPQGMSIDIPFDDSVYTESSVNDALMNVVLGILFTAIILFLFLHDIRTTIIVSISVPVSLIGTFIAIRYMNGSLNMMTLMSFSVAIGALISNSIVVIENILRLRKQGMDIKTAAVEGTREVMMAVIASTGTNLVVFLPIASMSSITGAFFREYALTISAATVFSLIVSFMLTPMLTSLLMKKEREAGALAKLMMRFFDRLEQAYERSLAQLMAKKSRPIFLFLIMFAFFILSAGLLSKIGFEFEPYEDDGNLFVKIEMPAGTAIERSNELLELVESKLANYEEVKMMLSVVNPTTASTSIKLIDKNERSLSNIELAEMIAQELKQIPEVITKVSIKDSEEGAPLQFTLQSDKQEDLLRANELVAEKMSTIQGLLNYESSAKKGNPLIHLEPKQRELSELGLNPFILATQLRTAINGLKSTVLRENGREYDIVISYPDDQINSLDKIRQLPVFTANGEVFLVDQLVDVSYKTSQTQILHRDKTRTIEYTATPAAGVVMGDARANIQTALDEIDLPQGVEFSWAGNVKELDETVADMVITFAMALLLMYMLLASLLESTWQPIVIFTTVPMAMIGVFVFMYLGGHTMNIMALMAIVTLLGLVVNDDILIHDYTEQLMHKEQLPIKEATLLAGKRKMKTVIMTTVAIIVGMLPNAIGLGDAGAAYRTPMAIVTIGGMITSTILTLYLIPSLFYVIRAGKEEM